MIGLICKNFRKEVLQKTLKEFEEKTGVNFQTISAFENGRSNNFNHMKLYYSLCENDLQKTTLSYNITNYLGRTE